MYSPRWYQHEAEYAIFDYFQKGNKGNPIVAMPTGTGKSVVIGNFITNVLKQWPEQRLMMLTHVKELIQQNSKTLLNIWPVAPIGIHSAGLNSRDMLMPIIFGGVQSVANTIKKANQKNDGTPFNFKHFGWRDLLLIDECHLLSPKDTSTYQFVISELMKINPYLKIIGFTATHYRLKQGLLTDGDSIFTDTCYNITDMNSFNRLISEGYLSTLICKPTFTKIDLSNVGIVAGEFNSKQVNEVVDKDEVTYSAVKETCELGFDRDSWLIFSSSVANAENVAAMFQSFGIEAHAVHSKLPSKQNDERIAAFKNGEIRALVNNNKLTTGFDHPPIDLICDLQPTMSPAKHVQKYGRGTRPSPNTGKQNCLVLDFAGNVPRLGPINDPVLPKRAGKGTGDAPIRICDSCGVYNHAAARFCICCGKEFTFETKLKANAGNYEIIKTDAPIIEYCDVQMVVYNLHEKKNREGILISPPSIKVSYFCGFSKFNEWICLEHSGLAGKKARDWWRERHSEEPPLFTSVALQKINELRKPKKIRVWINKDHPEVLGYEY